MAEALVSRSSWLNSLHMSTLTVALLQAQAQGHAPEAVLEVSGICTADLRGFSETAGLRHALQRWSGQPPGYFRV
ncbi:hypothetical protein ACVW0Y_002303 [Pseudomonas sp. TE3786]